MVALQKKIHFLNFSRKLTVTALICPRFFSLINRASEAQCFCEQKNFFAGHVSLRSWADADGQF